MGTAGGQGPSRDRRDRHNGRCRVDRPRPGGLNRVRSAGGRPELQSYGDVPAFRRDSPYSRSHTTPSVDGFRTRPHRVREGTAGRVLVRGSRRASCRECSALRQGGREVAVGWPRPRDGPAPHLVSPRTVVAPFPERFTASRGRDETTTHDPRSGGRHWLRRVRPTQTMPRTPSRL